jgi:hypothetical protein
MFFFSGAALVFKWEKRSSYNESESSLLSDRVVHLKSAPLGERTLPEAVVDTIDKGVAAQQMCTESRSAEKLRVIWTKGIVPTFQ